MNHLISEVISVLEEEDDRLEKLDNLLSANQKIPRGPRRVRSKDWFKVSMRMNTILEFFGGSLVDIFL